MRYSRFLTAAALFGTLLTATARDQPNILLILADDMGYGDLGVTGTEIIQTPHIDSLAGNGILCTQGYIPAAVCAPSRAGILTGRDPRRFGFESNLNQGPDGYPTRPVLQGLPVGEHTLGDQLKSAGYATALIGKWHQGASEPFHPNKRGFDHFYGMLPGNHNYFPNAKNSKLELNGEPVTEFETPYLTDIFTNQSLAWMKETDETSDKPWFLFASYNAPHTPMQAKEEDLEKYAHVKDKTRRTYAAMMDSLDQGVGRLLHYLEETGERDNTLVVFLSDNGGAHNNGSWNGPLSGRKGTAAEGGIRTPILISWPAELPEGATRKAPTSALDLVPTFMAAAGTDPLELSKPASYEDNRNRRRAVKRYGAYDGINLLPELKGDQEPGTRTLFWRLQGQTAVLSGDHKLIQLSHRPAQLFNPATDPGEQNDLSLEKRDTLKELFSTLGTWESHLATVPLFGSSPRWDGESADLYDQDPIEEPK